MVTSTHQLYPRTSQGVQWRRVALLPLIALVALVGGIAAALGAVLAVAMLSAVLVGVGIMMLPRLHMAFAMVFALVITGVLEFFFFFGQANWLSSVIVGSMLATALVKALWRRTPGPGITAFEVLVLGYFVCLIASSLINRIPLAQWIVGARNYLPYFGVAALLVYGDMEIGFLRKLPRVLVWVALLQIPVTLVQFFVVGPWRGGQRGAVGRADEAIVGTFGGSALTGGYTGEMAAFLVMAIVFVLALRRERLVGAFRATLTVALLCVPILIAETKIAIVLLPVLVGYCFARDIVKNPRFAIGVLALGGTLVTAVAATYFYRYWESGTVASQQLLYSFDPNFMVTPEHRGRVGTVVHWWQVNMNADLWMNAFLGHGVASSLEGSLTLGLGSAVKRFGLGLDAHAMSRLLWDGGLTTFLLLLWVGLRSSWTALRMTTRSEIGADDRAVLTFLAGACLAMSMMFPYQMSILGGSAMQFLFWFSVGYVELYRRTLATPSRSGPREALGIH